MTSTPLRDDIDVAPPAPSGDRAGARTVRMLRDRAGVAGALVVLMIVFAVAI